MALKQEVINIKKVSYQGVPSVEYYYFPGIKNYVEENRFCAVKTKKGLCIIGRAIEIQDDYMIINTVEIGKVKVEYIMIIAMFPCSFPDDYGV